MREQQTDPKQPRDEEGRARGVEHLRSPREGTKEQVQDDDRDRAEGRDRPPSGRDRGRSPWLGGG
jgi:hypothetical protein